MAQIPAKIFAARLRVTSLWIVPNRKLESLGLVTSHKDPYWETIFTTDDLIIDVHCYLHEAQGS